MRPEDLRREARSFRLLRQVGPLEAVLIGGYAVSAYSPPRFSVDLDLVLLSRTLPAVETLLRGEALTLKKAWPSGKRSAIRSQRWESAHGLSADLFIGGVSDRVSSSKHSFREVRTGAARRRVRGLAPDSEAEVLVPAKEVLIGLKLESGRLVDLRDVAVLAEGDVDVDALARFFHGVLAPVVRQHVEALAQALDTLEFENSLKGVYAMDSRAYTRCRRATLALCRRLRRSNP